VRRALTIAAGLLLVAAAALLGAGYLNAVQAPQIVRASLPVPGLRVPVTVALLSDTHRGWPDMPASRLRAVVAQVNALGADAVVLAGDYSGGKLTGSAVRTAEAIGPFAALRAPLGVYMVGGNHDWPSALVRVTARNGAPTLLANAHADLGPLVLGGGRSATDAADAAAAFTGAPLGKPRIFVVHEPDYLLWLPPGGAAWTLSGHTHGGQVQLPGAEALRRRMFGPIPCRRGACTLGGHRVFVTSGVGTSWLPLRFGVPPEIALLTLTPA
jgi:predicted MPP superfamily phosphohydrolase